MVNRQPIAGQSPSRPDESLPPVSLLWPPGRQDAARIDLDEHCVRDLDLEEVAAAFAPDWQQREYVKEILFHPCRDPDVIRYRQDVIDDLLSHPALAARLEELFPLIEALKPGIPPASASPTGLYEVSWRLGELETYVECVKGLSETLAEMEDGLRSEAFGQLRDVVSRARHDARFESLVAELPGLLSDLRGIASVTIGVNLDRKLQPVAATLVSVNKEPYRESPLVTRLLGRNDDEWSGIAQLHAVPKKKIWASDGLFAGMMETDELVGEPMMIPLFRDLAQVLKRVSLPLAKALKRFSAINTRSLGNLGKELVFYLGAVALAKRITASGLSLCRPAMAPVEERLCEVQGCYSLGLALQLLLAEGQDDLGETVVRSDVELGPRGRIGILTGPNQGGKTTYTKAVGLVHVLAQAGLPVPGEQARLSPVDGIYTHFPIEERPDNHVGRLGDEAKRFDDVLARATRHSLILLNESLTSTSAGESLYLARDVVRVLRLLGVRAVFSTHLHELAASVDELNAMTSGDSQLVSLVASLISEEEAKAGLDEETVRRTFKVAPNPPVGHSCAMEVAARYGISFDQMVCKLQERGVLTVQKES